MIDGQGAWADEARLPLDPHLLRADGCFETALVVSDHLDPSAVTPSAVDPTGTSSRVLALELHLARLSTSLERLRLFDDTTALRTTLRNEVARLLTETPDPFIDRVLRITVTPGLRLLELRALPERVHLRRRGLALHPLLEPRRDGLMTRHKTLAWSVHASATRQHPRAADPSFEGVWLAEDGHVLEGTATNLFVLQGEEIATPPTQRPILPGTARARVLEALRELGLEVQERDLTVQELVTADAVLATSSLLLVAPALSYRDQALRQPPSALIASIIERLRA